MIVKNVEKKENSAALFQVEADKAEFEKAVNAAYLKNRKNIYIPGFRKGKAPRAIVEGMYGPEVFYQDAMDELAPKAYELGVTEAGLKVVGAPSISDVNVTEEHSVVYTFAVSLYPEVTLGQYKGLEAEKPGRTVSDAEVNAELESVRKRNARKVSVEDREARMGDTVDVDFDGFLNGERFDGGKADNYSLELGSNSFVPGFEEQVAGMTIGEEKDINITFPKEYVEDLAGKDVVFKVKLNGITFPELPALDDDFAQDVSEFDTLDAYKESLRETLQKRVDEQADSAFRAAVMQQACDNLTVVVPEVMVTEKMEEVVRNYAANFGMTDRNMPLEELYKMMGLDDATLNSAIRPSAMFQVKHDLLQEAVVAAEALEASDEELEAYVERVANSVGAPAESVKQYFGMEYIKNECLKEKADELIYASAVVKEPEDKAE